MGACLTELINLQNTSPRAIATVTKVSEFVINFTWKGAEADKLSVD